MYFVSQFFPKWVHLLPPLLKPPQSPDDVLRKKLWITELKGQLFYHYAKKSPNILFKTLLQFKFI